MSVILLIHQLDKHGNRVKTHNYNKDPRVSLDKVTAFEELVGTKPQVYMTGLGAMPTQKKLVEVLARLSKSFHETTFIVERAPAEGLGGLTARSHISNGTVAPHKVRGG